MKMEQEIKSVIEPYVVPRLELIVVRDCATAIPMPMSIDQIKRPRCVNSPQISAEILMPLLQQRRREHFLILLLTTKKNIIGYHEVSVGSLNASIVHPREIFNVPLRESAASIILAHNHPSGDPTPSQEDLEVTRRLVEAGNILGIHITDHLIIGDGCYFSFKQKGLLP